MCNKQCCAPILMSDQKTHLVVATKDEGGLSPYPRSALKKIQLSNKTRYFRNTHNVLQRKIYGLFERISRVLLHDSWIFVSTPSRLFPDSRKPQSADPLTAPSNTVSPFLVDTLLRVLLVGDDIDAHECIAGVLHADRFAAAPPCVARNGVRTPVTLTGH